MAGDDREPESGHQPAPPPPPAPLDDEAGSSAARRFLGLFVVPLLVVLASVGVFVGFGWIAYDSNDISDYLNDLRSGWRPRRAQAAYELSKILVADPHALDEEPAVRAEVRQLFASAEDAEMRRYLALVLGHSRDPEAVPLLVGALEDEDSQTRIYALLALGSLGAALGDPGVLEPLAAAARDEDPGIRKTAAYALGEVGETAAIPVLEVALDDGIADVRWNAALALARLQSDAGLDVLMQMLDRDLLATVPGITPAQQEDAMVGAIEALAAVRGRDALAVFERLSEEDPSLKVRQAAITAAKALREG